MSNESTTTDLSRFGYREKQMAADLLNAMCNEGLPEDFEDDEVNVMMNMNSGNVFLTNSEYQVAMMNGSTLESFYTLPYSGEEGFKEEFEERSRDEFQDEDIETLIQLGIFEELKEEE